MIEEDLSAGGPNRKSISSSLPRSSMDLRNAFVFGFSATLLMRSSARRARCILANCRLFIRRRASPPSSSSERSSHSPPSPRARLRRSIPVVISWKSFSTCFSSEARSRSLFWLASSLSNLGWFGKLTHRKQPTSSHLPPQPWSHRQSSP